MKLKKILALTLALAMSAGLCACGGGEEAPAPEASADQPYAGTTIRVILAGHDWTNAIQPKLQEFTDATGIEVEFESYPEDQLSTKLNVELASGGQYIDVFMCRPLQEVQQFIQNGYLAEVSDVLADADFQKDDFITAALDRFTCTVTREGDEYIIHLDKQEEA